MVKRYTVTLGEEVAQILKAVPMGNTEAEKIKNIVLAWMSEKSLIAGVARKKLKLD